MLCLSGSSAPIREKVAREPDAPSGTLRLPCRLPFTSRWWSFSQPATLAARVHRKTGKVTRRLPGTWHVEQPQAVNERLVMYGEKWRGHPLGDDHSTIRRDLQTAHSRKHCHPAGFSASVVLAGPATPTPSYSPPNSRHVPPPGLPHQLAAEALVNMAWTAAGQQGTVQQQSLRMADQQQRSTMDSPATPNQEPCSKEPSCEPMPLAYSTPVEHDRPVHSQPSLLQPLRPALFAAAQHAPPLLHQHGPYIQDAAPPYSNAPQPPSPYSIAAPPPPPPTLYGFLLQSLPAARGPFCSIAPQPPPASAPPYSIVPQPARHPMSVTLSLQHTPAASECLWNAAPGALQQKFETLVMCNFTPTHPRELPTSRWVSFTTLYRLFRPHNWEDVWLMGPGNLKQLITKWYEGHPAFAGLDVKQWCKRLSNNETQGGRYVFKFCFEHTPNKAAAM